MGDLDRSIQVRVANTVSASRDVVNGVPQVFLALYYLVCCNINDIHDEMLKPILLQMI